MNCIGNIGVRRFLKKIELSDHGAITPLLVVCVAIHVLLQCSCALCQSVASLSGIFPAVLSREKVEILENLIHHVRLSEFDGAVCTSLYFDTEVIVDFAFVRNSVLVLLEFVDDHVNDVRIRINENRVIHVTQKDSSLSEVNALVYFALGETHFHEPLMKVLVPNTTRLLLPIQILDEAKAVCLPGVLELETARNLHKEFRLNVRLWAG